MLFEASNVILELKYIMLDKNICESFENFFKSKQIQIKNIFCTSYINSIGLINKLDVSGFNSFIDIGFKKSSLTIFEDKKLIYLGYTHIAGDNITKDINKILKIDYRTAEAKKFKFSKKNIVEMDLLKQIIQYIVY